MYLLQKLLNSVCEFTLDASESCSATVYGRLVNLDDEFAMVVPQKPSHEIPQYKKGQPYVLSEEFRANELKEGSAFTLDLPDQMLLINRKHIVSVKLATYNSVCEFAATNYKKVKPSQTNKPNGYDSETGLCLG